MNIKNNILIIFAIIPFIFFLITCTENGVECGLTGKWSIVDVEYENLSVDVKDVSGLLEITYNDTYEVEMELELENGIEYDIDDYGELKACAIYKNIQFFGDDDDGDAVFAGDDDTTNCKYILNSSNLTIYNDDFTMKLTKTYQ